MRDFKNDSAKTLSRFGRDKREEATTNERAERRPRLQRDAADSEQRAPRRASYNPNFTSDNRPKGGQGGERKEYGDRKPYGERKEYGDRKPYGDRDRKPYGERKEFSDRKPYGDRDRKPYGERKEFGDRKPYGDRDRKPYGERKEFGDRKPYGDRERKPYGERKEFGDREERKDRFERPKTPANNNYPKYNPNEQTGEMRLNRYIAQSGLCSRREADEYISAGVVSVNGVIVKELGTKVMPTDEIKFNDEQVKGEKKVYLVLNKPKGFVTSSDDPHADKTVMDLVCNACTERIYPVGRLDKNSLGVLLFTNDGDLTKQLTHPSHRKKKIYQVSLDKPFTRADLESLASGITLEDGEIFADEISYVSENREEVGLEIHSGRNRIVRRMFEHLGYSVQKLDRVYFAGLTKKNLKRGQWRFLTREEVDRLKSGRYE